MEPVTMGLISAVAAGALYLRRRSEDSSSELNLPPGPEVPILGGLPAAISWSIKNPDKLQRDRLLDLRDQYGPVFGYTIGQMQIIVVNEPATIRKVLNNPDFQGRTKLSMLESAFKGRGVIMAEGDRWRQHKRFTMKVLRDFGLGRELMEARMMRECTRLENALAVPSSKGETVNLGEYLPKATINVICSIIYGQPIAYDNPDLDCIVDDISEVNNIKLFSAIVPLLFPFLNTPGVVRHLPGSAEFQQAVESLYERARLRIHELKQQLAEDNNECSEPANFITAYLKEQARRRFEDGDEGVFTDEDLEADCVQLFVGGTENIAVTLRWGLLRLAMEPRLQERLRAEQLRSPPGPASWANRSQYPLTMAFTEEVFRFHTNVPNTFKCPLKPGLKVDDYDIPMGSMMLIDLNAANMNEELWEQPREFRPERHLHPEDGHFLGAGRVFTFATGRRACLGEQFARQSVFLLLTALVRRFDVRLPGEEASRLDVILSGTEGVSCKPQDHQLRLIDLYKGRAHKRA